MLGSRVQTVNGILHAPIALDTCRARFTECWARHQRAEAVMINEHARFQLEASKLGRDHVFQVTVFEKEERRRKRYFAETQCSDPFHLVIQFIIRDAPDFDGLLQRFVGQLQHRGFEPRRMRLCTPTGKWQAWGEVPHVGAGPLLIADEPPAIETADERRITGVKNSAKA